MYNIGFTGSDTAQPTPAWAFCLLTVLKGLSLPSVVVVSDQRRVQTFDVLIVLYL